MSEMTDNTGLASRWASAWHVPALVAGMMLFGLGVYLSQPDGPEKNFPGSLNDASAYLEARNFEKAEELLNGLAPHIDRAAVEDRARVLLLQGDLVFLRARERGKELPRELEAVIDLYRAAERDYGAKLGPDRLRRMAESHVTLGADDRAMEVVERIRAEFKDHAAADRYGVIRQIIERRLTLPPGERTGVGAMLERFFEDLRGETDAARRREQMIWAVRTRASLMLASDEASRASEYLVKELIQFRAQGRDNDLAALEALLAQAYQREGRFALAREFYEQAMRKVSEGHPLAAEILTGLGQLDLDETGDYTTALEQFSEAMRRQPSPDTLIDALIGRAHSEARLEAHGEAVRHFQEAVARVMEKPAYHAARRRQIEEMVKAHYEDQFHGRGEYDQALNYLSVLRPLYGRELPAEVLEMFAATHERIAEQRKSDASREVIPIREGGAIDSRASDARERLYVDAAVHYELAAEYYRRHGAAMTVVDSAISGQSLWKAAVSYDQAQRWPAAIEMYTLYVHTREDDSLRLDAIQRLGLAYQADGQYLTAMEQFSTLIENHPRSPQAYASLVPLARCHIALKEYDAAKRVLESVVVHHPTLTPESTEYRHALIELGTLHHRLREYGPAVEHLEVATALFGSDPELGATLKFQLADSYRQSIAGIEQDLAGPLSPAQKQALEDDRTRRLEEALRLFGEVVESIKRRSPESLTAVEAVYQRNAYFYRADCAYDLGRREEALALYDEAVKRWQNHPASLVALVQIVNIHSELGQTQAARAANRRARDLLNMIPDEAFADPTLPMAREHWERWLRWSSELDLFAQGPVSGAEADR